VFVERKILKRLHGEDLRELAIVEGWNALRESVDTYLEQGLPQFTSLVHNLKDVDPDDAFSSVPYERGSAFLFYLESVVGGPSVFEPFLKKYIETFSGKTLTSEDFRQFFLNYFQNPQQEEALSQIDWKVWYEGTGMPPVDVTSKLSAKFAVQAKELAKKWSHTGTTGAQSETRFSSEDIKGWHTTQLIVFLDTLLEQTPPVSVQVLQQLGTLYQFSTSRNSEIRFRFARLSIRASDESSLRSVVSFLKEQGRMKFTRPLYRDLFNKGEGPFRDAALSTFQEHRKNYHSITQKMVAKDLQLPE